MREAIAERQSGSFQSAMRMQPPDLMLIDASARGLKDFSELGRPGEVVGTRELIPHPSYRIVYQLTDDTIFILALVHTSRQWPPDSS